MPEFCRQNDGDCYTLKKQAISFEDQMNEHAFINEPFTLAPNSYANNHGNSNFLYGHLSQNGLKMLLIFLLAAFIFVRRRFITGFIVSFFRSMKFISIN